MIARAAEFHRAFEKYNLAARAHRTRSNEIAAMPDHPPLADANSDRPGFDRWMAFKDAQGLGGLWDELDAATRACGKAANRVSAIPAQTYRGAVEKVKVANLATEDDDDELVSHQDSDNPWMKKAIADLERLAGVS